MTFGAGSFGWLGLLIWPALMAGIILVVVWAVGAAGRGSEGEPLRELRSRFARGDIDAAQFEETRRVLGASDRPRTGARLGLLGLVLIVGALLAWIVASVGGSGGWN